jgi:hypothetical protein
VEIGSYWDLTADLVDISLRGIGFDLGFRDATKIQVGHNICIKCPWNPQLFNNSRYVVRSVKGQRVGAEKIG